MSAKPKAHTIEWGREADWQYHQFKAGERKIIDEAIEGKLVHQPFETGSGRKCRRPNEDGIWQLTVRNFRILYTEEQCWPAYEDAMEAVVLVIAVGVKIGNLLYIKRKSKPDENVEAQD